MATWNTRDKADLGTANRALAHRQQVGMRVRHAHLLSASGLALIFAVSGFGMGVPQAFAQAEIVSADDWAQVPVGDISGPASGKTGSAVSQEPRAVAARQLLGLPSDFHLTQGDIKIIEEMNSGVGRLDRVYGFKGMDIPYPSFTDSVFKDYGGIRSALAEHGFGIVANLTTIGAANTLNTPRNGPGTLLRDGTYSNQQYWGQQPSALLTGTVYLTYDLSRWGVPDGQFVIAGAGALSSWEPYIPNQIGLGALSWYQTLFDKKVEIKVGYVANSVEWMGTAVGGNIASPLGVAATVPFQMGLSATPAVQPSARVTWHINEVIYNQVGIMRSLPINGKTQNPIYDNAIYNPSNFDFNVPNGKMLLMDELGLKIPALPKIKGLWLRGGLMYNESDFADYRGMLRDAMINPYAPATATSSGTIAGYIMGDVQLMQFDPTSLFTAYRGLYLGGSAMWGPEDNLAFNEYYEGRAYILGPVASRPKDQLSFVYNYNGISKYARDYANLFSSYTGQYANTMSQSFLVSYTAHMTDGVYATLGLSYTENPSMTYTKDEGDSLNLLFSIFMNL